MHGQGREAGSPAGPHSRWNTRGSQGQHDPDPFDTPDSSGSDQGPDFYADYDSDCEATACFGDGRIYEGDLIRAVGYKEYAHADCAEGERDA